MHDVFIKRIIMLTNYRGLHDVFIKRIITYYNAKGWQHLTLKSYDTQDSNVHDLKICNINIFETGLVLYAFFK